MHMLLSMFTSFIIAIMMIPALISLAARRNIFDEPGDRKLHKQPVPLLGGVAVFAGTLISFLFWSSGFFEPHHLYILASLMILFIAGFIDDLQPLRPAIKLFLQVVAAAVTVLFAGVSFTGLHGLFGVHSISGIFPFLISLFFILVIVNAFNFIDGIDGLAASIGILASACFGFMFISLNEGVPALLSFALCGSLAAFLLFNASPAKIFMGDTGTLVTGFILSLLTIQLTEVTRETASSFPVLNYRSAPVFALALLIIPFIDFIRVTTVRLLKGRSPVKADKNHIHHVLVTLGLNHAQTTLLLIFINFLFIAAAFLFTRMDQSVAFFTLLAAGLLLSQLPYLFVKIKMKKSTL